MFHQRCSFPPAESSRSSALRVCHSAVDCSPVPADYVGLSSASVDVTGLAADHEDTGSSQTIVVRSVAATGASVRTRARGHRRCIGRRQQSLFDLFSVGDELPSVHPSEEENGPDMDDPGFKSDSEGKRMAEMRRIQKLRYVVSLYQYCFMVKQY